MWLHQRDMIGWKSSMFKIITEPVNTADRCAPADFFVSLSKLVWR